MTSLLPRTRSLHLDAAFVLWTNTGPGDDRLFCRKGVSEGVFLLFGQVRRDQLKFHAFEFGDDFVLHSITGHQKQRGSAFGDLLASFLDEIIVDTIIRHLPTQCAHGRADREAKEGHEEDQAEEHTPKSAIQSAHGGQVYSLLGFRGFSALWPADGSGVLNFDKLVFLQHLYLLKHLSGPIRVVEFENGQSCHGYYISLKGCVVGKRRNSIIFQQARQASILP
jgi:hypothetical protein